jgi:thiol-disulfide isomerase/thioredoxin
LLIKEVAAEFGSRVKVVTEEYGNSETAKRFGVRRYPVVFVDDVLVARPKDFGFKGAEDVGSGRYVPWREPQNQARFREDLRRWVRKRLQGEQVEGYSPADVGTVAAEADGPAALPGGTMADLDGRTIRASDLEGRVVLVEMWATWCPPCRSTLAWLNDLQQKHADRVAVVAIAVDSKEEDVRKLAGEIKPVYRMVMGTPETLQAYGTVAAVPKLFVFGADGRAARVFYGAPPDLHQQVESAIATLLRPR